MKDTDLIPGVTGTRYLGFFPNIQSHFQMAFDAAPT